LESARFWGCDLYGANFSGATLTNVIFKDCCFGHGDLIEPTNFENAIGFSTNQIVNDYPEEQDVSVIMQDGGPGLIKSSSLPEDFEKLSGRPELLLSRMINDSDSGS